MHWKKGFLDCVPSYSSVLPANESITFAFAAMPKINTANNAAERILLKLASMSPLFKWIHCENFSACVGARFFERVLFRSILWPHV